MRQAVPLIDNPDTKKVPPNVSHCLFAGEIEWVLCVTSDSLSSAACQLEPGVSAYIVQTVNNFECLNEVKDRPSVLQRQQVELLEPAQR